MSFLIEGAAGEVASLGALKESEQAHEDFGHAGNQLRQWKTSLMRMR